MCSKTFKMNLSGRIACFAETAKLAWSDVVYGECSYFTCVFPDLLVLAPTVLRDSSTQKCLHMYSAFMITSLREVLCGVYTKKHGAIYVRSNGGTSPNFRIEES